MSGTVSRYEEEIRVLQDQVYNKNQTAFKSFKVSINESLSQPGMAIPSTLQLRQLNELEEQLAEKDNSAAALRDKLRIVKQESDESKLKHEQALRQLSFEKKSLKHECSEEVHRLEDKNDDLQRQLEDMKKQLEVQCHEVEIQKDVNARAPTTMMKNMVEKLRNQLALKEKQLQMLNKMLLDLQGDTVLHAQSAVKANADQNAAELNVKRLVDKQTKELMDRLDELDATNKKLKVELKKSKEKEKDLESHLEQSQNGLSKKELLLKKVKEDKDSLTSEIDELKQKVLRMGTMSRQRTETDGFHHEMDELRRKNRILSEELERQKLQPEKPYEQQGLTPGRNKLHQNDVVVKWGENKIWEKKVEFLKTRVREKDIEIEKLIGSNEILKNSLDRANKDKEILDARLRSSTDMRTDGAIKLQHGSNLNAIPQSSSSGAQTHIGQELKKHNHELQDEISSLKRQLLMGRDAAFEEVMLRNKFLSDKLQQLEQNMSQLRSSSLQQDRGVEYRDLALREDQLQKQVIKLSEENLELRFEVEQAHKDIPRLKSRNEDLQKYVEILKSEKSQLELMSRSRESLTSAFSTPSSNIRRIGESGRSAHDLEKTIALLKKVVERSQQENERLKKTPSLISGDHLSALQSENQALKSQLDELREKIGAGLSERYVSKQKGTAKIMSDYEKVRKDLVKEIDGNEKLRIRLSQVEILLEQREKELEGKQSQLELEQSRKASLSALDSKGYKSVIQARISEDRIKVLEDDLDNKSKLLTDVKILVREAASKEQQLQHEKQDLEEKIAVLERFPGGTKVTDTDLMRDYQLARLTIDRLENEKKELLHELQYYRKKSNPNAGGATDIVSLIK